jgi:ketosteroid isomerase-like protein
MTQVDVVRSFWAAITARDWAGMAALLHPDVIVAWPATGERFVGRDNVVAVNAEYPEGWSIQVLRVMGDEEIVVSEVEVPHEGLGVFRAASFWTVRDGVIVAGTEYWVGVGAEEPPAWRAPYAQRV